MRNHYQEQPLEKGCNHRDDKDTCAHVYVTSDNRKIKTQFEYLLVCSRNNRCNQKGYSDKEVNFRERVVLHQTSVAQLDSDGVVYHRENEEESICHKVLLSVVA